MGALKNPGGRGRPARVGDTGADISYIQRRLHVYPADGLFTETLATRIRGVQLAMSLDVDGEINDSLARKLGWKP